MCCWSSARVRPIDVQQFVPTGSKRCSVDRMSKPESNEGTELRETAAEWVPPLAPPDVFDPVIEAYKKDVDRTLIRENLRRSPHERAARMQAAIDCVDHLRGAAWRRKSAQTEPKTRHGS